MLLITGGAGFIGSNLVAALNERGRTDLAICDRLGSSEKWRNLANRTIADFVPPVELAGWLLGRKLDAVIHLGAISSTTVRDADLVVETNFRLSLMLLDWCATHATPFIYASSSATYGNGECGFRDDWSIDKLKQLRPLNLYGWSKHLFDLAISDRYAKCRVLPPQWVGLKFFNVFGPNEFHKGTMASALYRAFEHAKSGQAVQLFKSHRVGIADGDQHRDFIFVDDALAIILWFLDNSDKSGIFNVGTGQARSFRDLIKSMFLLLDRVPSIEYVDMPENIRNTYQYFTQAEVGALRQAGYSADFTSLEDGIERYLKGYLSQPDKYR